MKKRTKVTVLNITSRCNLRCPFCFGPENIGSDEAIASSKNAKLRPVPLLRFGTGFRFATPKRELSTAQAKKLILKLKKSGAKTLIFSGGEPLLRPDIFDLICFAKNLGFFTVLHTNGVLLCKKIFGDSHRISYLDQINLPLDGYSAKTNDAMRGKGHFKKVMQALKLLSSLAGHKPRSARLRNSKIRVIISTVATRKNKKAVAKIGKILPEWIFKWRIFQFNPQGKAARVKKEFYLSDEKFEKIKKEIYRLKPELRNIKVQCISLKDKEFWESYKIISNF